MNKAFLSIRQKMIQKIMMDHLVDKILVLRNTIESFFKSNFNKIFISCFILIGWIGIFHFIKSLQFASHEHRGMIISFIFFTIEVLVLSVLFISWFVNFKKSLLQKELTSTEAPTLLDKSTLIEIEKKAENKKETDFSFLLNNKEDTKVRYRKLLHLFTNLFNAGAGIIYELRSTGDYSPIAAFALPAGAEIEDFVCGDGLPGQAVANKKPLLITDIPETHLDLESGLGKCKPVSILFIPIILHHHVIALVELQSFTIPDMIMVEQTSTKISGILENNQMSLNL